MDKFKSRATKTDGSEKQKPESSTYWFKLLDPEIDIKNVNEIVTVLINFLLY